MIDNDVFAVFVYGTLKRGESNHWLLEPFSCSVEAGWVRGRLYDLGDFPALVDGYDRVHGEIVQLNPEDLPRVLAVLDRLEGCLPDDDAASLYHRRAVQVNTDEGPKQAYAYFYNPVHPSLLPLDALRHVEAGVWSGASALPGPEGGEAMEAYRAWVRTFRSADVEREQGL